MKAPLWRERLHEIRGPGWDLATNLGHTPTSVTVALSESVAPWLPPDAGPNHAAQIVVRSAGTEQIAQINLVVAEETEPKLAVGG
jgi:hypothetical protein